MLNESYHKPFHERNLDPKQVRGPSPWGPTMKWATLCTENSKSHGVTSTEIMAGAKSRDFLVPLQANKLQQAIETSLVEETDVINV